MESVIEIIVLFYILFTSAALEVQNSNLFESDSTISIVDSCVLPEKKLDHVQCMRLCLRSGETCKAIYADGESCHITKCQTHKTAVTSIRKHLFLRKVANVPSTSGTAKDSTTTEKATTIDQATSGTPNNFMTTEKTTTLDQATSGTPNNFMTTEKTTTLDQATSGTPNNFMTTERTTTTSGTTKYFLTTKRANTLDGAKKHCDEQQSGSKPAEPLSLVENEAIKKLIMNSTHCDTLYKRGFFLGLLNPSGYEITTSDSTPVSYDTSKGSGIWPDAGQPDNENQFLISIMCDGKWGDRKSNVDSYDLHTVCEM